MSALLRELLREAEEAPVQNQRLAQDRTPALDWTPKRPRVLHLVTSFEAGGTERQFVELLKRLNRQRFDVRLAALRIEGPFYQELALDFPDIPEFRLTSFYNRNALTQLRRLRALLRREGINIIHTHGFYDSLFGAVAGRLSGVRVIASQRHLQLSGRRVHDWGSRAIHRLADKIVVNSEAIRDSIRQRDRAAASKIIVIRNGLCDSLYPSTFKEEAVVDTTVNADVNESLKGLSHNALCCELGLPAQTRIIGMVARLVAVKGHRYFLEAAARVARLDERVHFVLVGDGPLKNDIAYQARQLGIGERVHMLGDRSDARRLVASFDLSVLTSLSEGLPNTVMEAMSAGVPVVATAVGGTTELIEDGETGFLIPPANVEALAAGMFFVLENEAQCQAIAQRGREFINSRFSMSRMVESVERLYEELMSNPMAGETV
jgi:glycosyltransferase involved in cell wall biosynthesis